MKLLYASVLGLVSAGRWDARFHRPTARESFRCNDYHAAFRGGSKGRSVSEYNQSIDDKIAAFQVYKDSQKDEICAEIVTSETCQTIKNIPEDEIETWLEDNFETGTECGTRAEKFANELLSCQLCDVMSEIDDNMLEGITVRGIGSGQESNYLTALTSSDIVKKAVGPPQSSADEEDKNSLEGAGKNQKKSSETTMYEIKVWFKKMNEDVWNVVVSGGPEYCKDMMPKYPRIAWGKMKPGHANWPALKDIRDKCVVMHGVIKGTKCFCVYLLWGCPDKTSGTVKCPMSWQKQKGSNSERRYCFYFANLKGGVTRPLKKPTNALCKTDECHITKTCNNKGTFESFIEVNKKCLQWEKKEDGYVWKTKYVKRGRRKIKRRYKQKKFKQVCVAYEKANIKQCYKMTKPWCHKINKKRKHLVNKCMKKLENKSLREIREWCLKVGLDMQDYSHMISIRWPAGESPKFPPKNTWFIFEDDEIVVE